MAIIGVRHSSSPGGGCFSGVTRPFVPLTRDLAIPPGCQRCRPAGRRSPRGPRHWSSHPPAAAAPCACVRRPPPRAAASAGAGRGAPGAAAAGCSCPRGPPPGPHSATRDPPAAPADREGTGEWADPGSQRSLQYRMRVPRLPVQGWMGVQSFAPALSSGPWEELSLVSAGNPGQARVVHREGHGSGSQS